MERIVKMAMFLCLISLGMRGPDTAQAQTFTQTFYVRPPGQTYGTGNGSSWTDAYSDLPENLARGAKYYMASGEYDIGPYPPYYEFHAFNDSEQGDTYIGVFKATLAEHGTETGWDDSFGQGSANIGPISFTTGYYIIDGIVGEKDSGHGIRLSTKDCGNSEAKVVRFPWNSQSRYVELRNLDIGHCGEIDFYFAQDAIYGNVPISHVIIRNCHIHDSNRIHILMSAWDDILIEDCFFARSGRQQESSSLSPRNVTNVTVRKCFFKDAVNDFISLRTVTNFNIYSNVFFGTLDGWEIYSAIISAEPATNVSIYGNTFYGLKGLNTGIRFDGTFSNVRVYNNLWSKCLTNQIQLSGLHDYNAFYDNWRADPHYNLDERIVEDHVFVFASDPFVNGTSGDFHLTGNTGPGIGLPSPFDIDLDGNARGLYGTWNRGAFEYVPGLLTDVVLILKILTGIAPPSTAVYEKIDVVDDGRIGLEDAIYTLRILSGLN